MAFFSSSSASSSIVCVILLIRAHRALGAQGIEAEDEDRLIRILVVTIRVVFGCLDVMAKRKKFFPASIWEYGIPQLRLFPLCSSLLFSLE